MRMLPQTIGDVAIYRVISRLYTACKLFDWRWIVIPLEIILQTLILVLFVKEWVLWMPFGATRWLSIGGFANPDPALDPYLLGLQAGQQSVMIAEITAVSMVIPAIVMTTCVYQHNPSIRSRMFRVAELCSLILLGVFWVGIAGCLIVFDGHQGWIPLAASRGLPLATVAVIVGLVWRSSPLRKISHFPLWQRWISTLLVILGSLMLSYLFALGTALNVVDVIQ